MTEPCLDIEKLYELDHPSTYRKALDYLFEAVDDALWYGDKEQSWPSIEALCNQLDVEKMSVQMMIGVLSITIPIKNLPYRARFCSRVRERLEKTEPSERITKLLTGLESENLGGV